MHLGAQSRQERSGRARHPASDGRSDVLMTCRSSAPGPPPAAQRTLQNLTSKTIWTRSGTALDLRLDAHL